MEIDARTIATIFASLLVGGGGGVATSQVHLAEMAAEIRALQDIADGRKGWGERIAAQEALNEEIRDRMDRLDERKADQ